jgi:hypothetical protein
MLNKSILCCAVVVLFSQSPFADFSPSGVGSQIKNNTSYNMTVQWWCNGNYSEVKLGPNSDTYYSELCFAEKNITVKVMFDDILPGKAVLIEAGPPPVGDNMNRDKRCYRNVKIIDLSNNETKKLFPQDTSQSGAGCYFDGMGGAVSDDTKDYAICRFFLDEGKNLKLSLGRKQPSVLIARSGSY